MVIKEAKSKKKKNETIKKLDNLSVHSICHKLCQFLRSSTPGHSEMICVLNDGHAADIVLPNERIPLVGPHIGPVIQ